MCSIEDRHAPWKGEGHCPAASETELKTEGQGRWGQFRSDSLKRARGEMLLGEGPAMEKAQKRNSGVCTRNQNRSD